MRGSRAPDTPLHHVCSVCSGGTPSRDRPDYYSGQIPWVKSGELNRGEIDSTDECITEAALRDSAARLIRRGATLVAMYGATAGVTARLEIDASINQAVAAIVANDARDDAYLFAALETMAPDLLRKAQGSGQPNLNGQMINNLRIRWPEYVIRRQVGLVNEDFRRVLRSIGDLLNAKHRLKRALMQRLAPNSIDLKRGRLGEVTREITRRNDSGLGPERVMGVIKSEGLVPMREGLMADDLVRYRVVPPRAFAYNPMRINIGSIAYSWHEEDVLVSPDYVAFECDEERLDPRYLDHIRRSPSWTSFMGRAGNGSVRVRIYYADLAQFRMALPTLQVQQRVARLLDALDKEVALLEQDLGALRRQKRAVMRKLLSGEIYLPDEIASDSSAPEAELS